MSTNKTEVATLGGGCFWCLEAVYDDLRGVRVVESGYMGGHVPSPSYEEVCTGTTGHAEVVRVEFDPAEVSYRELLESLRSPMSRKPPNAPAVSCEPVQRPERRNCYTSCHQLLGT